MRAGLLTPRRPASLRLALRRFASLRLVPLALALLAFALLAACGAEFTDPSREFADPLPDTGPHPVVTHTPRGLGVLDTDRTDIHGAPIGIACATCHAPGADRAAMVESLGNPETMHSTIELKHGELTCGSCHDDDRSRLRLADGTTFAMDEAMRLCAQCHGPQKRDYAAGAHGGMSGYWDLSQGPRTRNHCLDCHSAHDPAFRGGAPVLPPRDRFLPPPGAAHHD